MIAIIFLAFWKRSLEIFEELRSNLMGCLDYKQKPQTKHKD